MFQLNCVTVTLSVYHQRQTDIERSGPIGNFFFFLFTASNAEGYIQVKVKFSHTRYRALGPELSRGTGSQSAGDVK